MSASEGAAIPPIAMTGSSLSTSLGIAPEFLADLTCEEAMSDWPISEAFD